MHESYRFEDFVQDTVSATSEAQLFGYLTKALMLYGYEQIVFAIFNEPDVPISSHHFGYYEHAVDEWNRIYTDRGFARIDPVVQAVKAGARAFTWEEMPKFFTLTRAQEDYMGLVGELGMFQGVAVSLSAGRAGLGLSTRDRSCRRPSDISMVTAICKHFYQVFRDLKDCRRIRDDQVAPLSVKERDVLTWVAAGKTDAEIAAILHISQSTVDAHLRSIFRKLGAFNRVSAVVQGLRRGHISL